MKFRNVESSNCFRFSQFLLCHTWLVKKITKNVMKQLFFVASEVFFSYILTAVSELFFKSQDSENRQQLLLTLSTDDTDLCYTDKVFSNVYEELHVFTKTMWHWGTDKGPDDLPIAILANHSSSCLLSEGPCVRGCSCNVCQQNVWNPFDWPSITRLVCINTWDVIHSGVSDGGGGRRGEPLLLAR